MTDTNAEQAVDRAATDASLELGTWIADYGSDEANDLWHAHNDAVLAWTRKNKDEREASDAHVLTLQARLDAVSRERDALVAQLSEALE